MADTADPKPGLQIERTHLAWGTTAFGYLAVSAVLLFPSHGPVSRGRVVLAALSIVLSLTVVAIARSRAASRPRTTPTVHRQFRARRLPSGNRLDHNGSGDADRTGGDAAGIVISPSRAAAAPVPRLTCR